MRYLLTITCEPRVLDAYWYGVGELISCEPEGHRWNRYVIDYGTDGFRAQYQADRFASGLYHAIVREVSGI